MDLQRDEMKAVILRLKRAQGHLGKVINMIEDESSCDDVLTQLAAVSKAINRSGYAIVATGLQHCLTDAEGDAEIDVARMEKLFLAFA